VLIARTEHRTNEIVKILTIASILLLPGALIILVAGAMRSTARDAENENGLNNIIASVQNRSNSR